jgi:hypothetical protein
MSMTRSTNPMFLNGVQYDQLMEDQIIRFLSNRQLEKLHFRIESELRERTEANRDSYRNELH